jgi:hypothetical protein
LAKPCNRNAEESFPVLSLKSREQKPPNPLLIQDKNALQPRLDLRGAYLNLDGGFDSAHNRKCIFNAGLIANIKGNPRNRKTTKRGRKRFFNEAIHALRMRVERTFAWEDKFKRLLIRFERIQQRHYGMKLLGYTLINLRAFCGT